MLHLDEASQTALRQQPAVLSAQAEREAATGRAIEARSTLLPQVTAIAAYQRIHGASRIATTTNVTPTGTGTATGTGSTTAPGTGGTTVTGSGTFDLWNFGASASQIIWDFGQGWDHWRAADRLVDAQRATERSTEAQVLLNVRRAYFQARAQRALVGVANDTLVNLQKHVEQIQGFVASGTRPEIDVLQARTDVANARVQLINAENAYELAKVQLNQAMGTSDPTDYDVGDEALGPVRGEDGGPEPLVTTAIQNRPELVALDRQRESEEMTVRAYKGGYGPTLSASGGLFETGTSLDQLGPTWNVGATLAWPIFQGGLTTGLVHEAKANLDATRAQLEAERLQVRTDVEQSFLSLRAAKATVDAAQEALANARERLRLAEGRYQSGVGSIIELGDAQVALTNAAAQAIQADLSVASARAQLLAAIGQR